MTIYIGGISCESCAAAVTKSVAAVPGLQSVKISASEKSLRSKVDADSFILQDLLKAIYGKDGKYAGRLGLLATPKPGRKEVERLRAALDVVPGFRAMTEPDSQGRLLLTFHMKNRTTLSQVLRAVSGTGVNISDPAPK